MLSPPPAATRFKSSALLSRDTRTLRQALPFGSCSAESTSGMLIDPGTAAPVRAGDDEVEHLAIAEQQVLHRGEELAHALAGERRDADRFARPRRLPAALLLANEIDLVRDLENRMGGPIEPELGEDLLDVLALRLALRMGGVAHMHDEIGVEHVFERRAERGDQRSRQIGNEADGIDEMRLSPCARRIRRAVGSSVAKSMSLATTPAAVRRLNSVDLPALV